MKMSEWLTKHDGKVVTVGSGSSIREDVLERLLSETCQRDVYVVDGHGRTLGHISHKRLTE